MPWQAAGEPLLKGSPTKSASESVDPRAEEGRYLAYTVWQSGFGNLFLWDAWSWEVWILNGALAGLVVPAHASLRPRIFGSGKKVLFTVGDKAFFWDFEKEERTTPVTDGRAAELGGPQAVVTPDGKWIAYVSLRETLVIKVADGVNIPKTIEPVEVAAEGPVWDLDMTGDATRFVLNIGGRAYFYDHWYRRLAYVLPLDGGSLAGKDDGLREVAVAPSGWAYAFAWESRRVALTDALGRVIATLPTVDLLDGRIVDLYFLSDDLLVLEVACGGALRVFAYDCWSGLVRALAFVNDPLPIPLK
jgi:hypothetical protein